MLTLFKVLHVLCSLALLAAARPALPESAGSQVELEVPAPDFRQSTLSICPTWTVRCVKDSKWPSGIVGDIGPQPFCFRFPRCYQCEEQANSDECNKRFEECEGACAAFSPIPF